MPTRTFQLLVTRALANGLDAATPAAAIARATRPDQAVIAAPVGELPEQLVQAKLAGPVLVMLGPALATLAQTQSSLVDAADALSTGTDKAISIRCKN
jgi:siroheme synthase